MPRKYPRYDWELVKQRDRRHPQCRSCQKIPGDGEKYYHVTIQVNWFRGDDEETFYCLTCGQRIKAEQKAQEIST